VNQELERYLRSATRGLWSKKRLEVMEELRAHVLERARKHQLEGSSQNEAIRKAVTELGQPHRIGLEMARQRVMRPSATVILALLSIGVIGQSTQKQNLVPITILPSRHTKLLGAEFTPIPLAAPGMARVQPIPPAVAGMARVAPIPLATSSAKPNPRPSLPPVIMFDPMTRNPNASPKGTR
jgi:hypothetical protein